MRISTDVLQTIDANGVDVSSAWLWVDNDTYDSSYRQILSQPISLEAITLDFCRWKVNTVTLIIRATNSNTSDVLFCGEAALIDDIESVTGATTIDIPASASILGSNSSKNLIAKTITVSDILPSAPPTTNDLFWIIPA